MLCSVVFLSFRSCFPPSVSSAESFFCVDFPGLRTDSAAGARRFSLASVLPPARRLDLEVSAAVFLRIIFPLASEPAGLRFTLLADVVRLLPLGFCFAKRFLFPAGFSVHLSPQARILH
jgi:hypothetical protein